MLRGDSGPDERDRRSPACIEHGKPRGRGLSTQERDHRGIAAVDGRVAGSRAFHGLIIPAHDPEQGIITRLSDTVTSARSGNLRLSRRRCTATSQRDGESAVWRRGPIEAPVEGHRAIAWRVDWPSGIWGLRLEGAVSSASFRALCFEGTVPACIVAHFAHGSRADRSRSPSSPLQEPRCSRSLAVAAATRRSLRAMHPP